MVYIYNCTYVYRTAGFVCEVLICANYASNLGLVNFNSAITFALLFHLTARVTVLYL